MLRRTLLMSLLAALGSACAQDARSGRVRPPEDIPCSRDELTAYMGDVAAYSRSTDAVQLTIHTDWNSTESVELRLKDGEQFADRFRINGEPFPEEGFAQIEAQPGKLKPGMRANVWVCEDSGPAQIDWRPKP